MRFVSSLCECTEVPKIQFCCRRLFESDNYLLELNPAWMAVVTLRGWWIGRSLWFIDSSLSLPMLYSVRLLVSDLGLIEWWSITDRTLRQWLPVCLWWVGSGWVKITDEERPFKCPVSDAYITGICLQFGMSCTPRHKLASWLTDNVCIAFCD